MRLKQSNFLAFRIHSSITETEEGGERREEEPKGQRQQGLRLQGVLGKGTHQDHGSRATLLQSVDSLSSEHSREFSVWLYPAPVCGSFIYLFIYLIWGLTYPRVTLNSFWSRG